MADDDPSDVQIPEEEEDQEEEEEEEEDEMEEEGEGEIESEADASEDEPSSSSSSDNFDDGDNDDDDYYLSARHGESSDDDEEEEREKDGGAAAGGSGRGGRGAAVVVVVAARNLPSFADACRRRLPLPAIRAIVESRRRRDPDFLVRRLRTDPSFGRRIPLHLAIAASCPDGVIDFLLEACPDSAKLRSKCGSYALHLALDRRVPPRMDTVRRLIGAWPQVLRAGDSNGSLPLHVLLGRTGGGGPATLPLVAVLAELFPGALAARDKNGFLPLHVAARNNALPLDVLEDLVWRSPAALRSRTRPRGGGLDGAGQRMPGAMLPLHVALQAKSPLDRIRLFLERLPESVRERDGDGNLPVHTVADLDVPPEALQLVVQRWPESVRERDRKRGRLPVHRAAAGASLAKVRHFADLWPESVREADEDGATPLHVALIANGYEYSVAVALYLASRSAAALEAADRRGRLPLHVAAAEPLVPPPVVRAVLERHFGAARAADGDGNLPLHAALSGRRPLEVVRLLAEQNPDALRHRNAAGLLPVQVALANWPRADDSRSGDVVRYLIQAWPESVQDRDADGRVLLHFVAGQFFPAGDHRDRIVPEQWPEALQELIEGWPEALQVRDSTGLLPLHAAASAELSQLDRVYRLARQRPDLLLPCRGGTGGGNRDGGRHPSARDSDIPRNDSRRPPGPLLGRGPSRRAKKRARA